MVSLRAIARLWIVAVGLGIGAAVASTPGVARADDFQISIDGMDLFSTVGNTATATSGVGDIAIAYGDGAYASAEGGTGDYALASGSGADALAGGASGDTGADNDTAIDIGTNELQPGYLDTIAAGNSDLVGATDGSTGSGDTAIDIGNNSGKGDDVLAGAGGLANNTSGNGNDDTAIDVGNNSGSADGAFAYDGSGNYASESGNSSGAGDYAFAGVGNDNTAINDASTTTITDGYVVAERGNDNYAYVLGPENSHAFVGDGDSNIAYILDPFGSTASDANSGAGASDLAAVLFTDGTANASAGSDLYDIVTAAGSEAGSAAATSGGWLADLLSLF
jgi:hypothetical protein